MTITPRLVASYPIPSSSTARTSIDTTAPVPRLEVHDAEALRLYDLREQAEPAAEFPAPSPEWWSRTWVAPDLSLAVFGTSEGYVAVARDGRRLWQQPYGTWRVDRWGYVDFAEDGAGRQLRIRLRLPSGLPDGTAFLTLSAEGTVLARSVLPCGGYERFVSLSQDGNGGIAGVTVSEGRTAVTRYEAREEADAIVLGRRLPPDHFPELPDDCEFLDQDPGDARCMTVDGRGREVSWRDALTLQRTASLPLSDFPAPGTGDCSVHNAPYISSWGGFVDDGTALVTLHNPYDEAAVYMFGEQDWREYSHWLADPATGALHGRVEYPMPEVDTVVPVGDGTWFTQEWNAYHRWRR